MELTSKGDGSARFTFSNDEQLVLANAAEPDVVCANCGLGEVAHGTQGWCDVARLPQGLGAGAAPGVYVWSPVADDLPSEPVGDTGQALNEHRPVQRSQPLTA